MTGLLVCHTLSLRHYNPYFVVSKRDLGMETETLVGTGALVSKGYLMKCPISLDMGLGDRFMSLTNPSVLYVFISTFFFQNYGII